jgi:hypothetical protein
MVQSRGCSSCRERESSAESFLKFRGTCEFLTGAARWNRSLRDTDTDVISIKSARRISKPERSLRVNESRQHHRLGSRKQGGTAECDFVPCSFEIRKLQGAFCVERKFPREDGLRTALHRRPCRPKGILGADAPRSGRKDSSAEMRRT